MDGDSELAQGAVVIAVGRERGGGGDGDERGNDTSRTRDGDGVAGREDVYGNRDRDLAGDIRDISRGGAREERMARVGSAG